MSAALSTYTGGDEEIDSSIPLGRWGRGSDMAGAAIFFASKAGAWCTGTILPVDGGMLSSPLSVGGPSKL